MHVKLLLVENSEAQAQVVLRPLREAGFEVAAERVASSQDLRAALDRETFDLVLCQHALPGLSYTKVLSDLLAKAPSLPCIVLAALGDEDLVSRALRLGARDFISMGRLSRLPQAVRRELAHGPRRGEAAPAPEPPETGLLEDLMDEAYGLHEVIFDAQGEPADFRFVRLNPAYERLTGITAPEVIGRSALELFPDISRDWIRKFGAVALSGQPLAVDDYRSLRGRTFAGLAFCPQPGHFAVLFNDVTAAQDLETTKERLATAVEQINEGIFIADLAGTLLYVNPALERILGTGPGAALGQPVAKILPGLPLEDPGAEWQGRFPGLPGDGRAQILECTLAPVRDASGRPASRVGIVHDVTREVDTERSLRQMEKMKALAEVAGGVSHDFNNLLAAILSATELIEWQLAADSPIRLKLQVIYQAVTRAGELNRQILAFSRTPEEKSESLDLSLVVKEAIQLVRSTFPATVQVRSALAAGLWTRGNASQLHQVVMNLSINALQAMLPAGGTLEFTLEAPEEGTALLTVKDSGCGMDPAVLERVFEPFFTTKERTEGKGLGLSVVHGIVHAHGGSITVRSEPGQGSVFQVALPCRIPEAPAALGSAGEPTGHERILFVDDEEVLSALGKQGLQMLGYRVTSRSDAQEALEEVTHHPQDFDLLVTDLSMPNMSGVELTQKIRRIRPDLPAILITGAFQDPVPLEGMATPFAQVLLKPVTILDMAKAVRKVMSLRPAPPARAEAPAEPRAEGASVILLAEDSQTTRSLLRSWLVKAGYAVDEARDGQEAWEALERNPGRYSILVTDIVMPRMDGLRLSGKVRGLDASIPILMLSSTDDAESVKEALHLHVSEFLTKPFESAMLVATVERLCADQATRVKVMRSHETAQAVRMAQRAMEAIPEKGMPIYSISEPLTDAGGDVFRAFRREDGSIFFAIADVAGHSVISSYAVAAYLGMLTNFLATDLDLRALAFKLNRAIQAGPFAEVPICGLFGHWNPATGRIHLLNAGIPHALWHRATRGATRAIAINGAPLGILDEPIVEEKVVILAPGDRLLLGSDGFFDALSADGTAFVDLAGPIWENLRGTDIFQAINLVSAAARAHAGGSFGDDLLVVALEQPPLAADPDGLGLDLPADLGAIDGACDQLEAFLDSRGWEAPPGGQGRYDTLLAVREALSNAILHGCAGDGAASVHLSARKVPGNGFRIAVVDAGQGFDLGAHTPPDTASSERGRGIPLMQFFADRVAMVGGELAMDFHQTNTSFVD
ncbi:response regulator [Mesoterricola silvestris]|uniref:histidine kinase n=1 Tax=Mesoterricola silvestris TaxID=2927979 RepID=A0AA48GL41_9BACT|nr:response regulator [Mesoterricola silvestris]BDU73377.1 hypothetical protein METEAL_25510 [Mesoterricola silvestris]